MITSFAKLVWPKLVLANWFEQFSKLVKTDLVIRPFWTNSLRRIIAQSSLKAEFTVLGNWFDQFYQTGLTSLTPIPAF